MNRALVDEARIIIDSAYVALERVKDSKDIDAIREMLREGKRSLCTLHRG